MGIIFSSLGMTRALGIYHVLIITSLMPCTCTTSWTTRDEGQLRTGVLPNRNEEIVNQEINRNEVYVVSYIAEDGT